jgi:hypothetical protein
MKTVGRQKSLIFHPRKAEAAPNEPVNEAAMKRRETKDWLFKSWTMPEAHKQVDKQQPGSNRSFGFVFAGVFAVVVAYIFIKFDRFSVAAAAACAIFLLCALFVPQVLSPLNKLWFRFGLLVHKIVSPVVLGIIFFGVFTPAGLLLKLFSKHEEKTAGWINRTSDGPERSSFRNQF